ncbi:hypothetical protein M378DRAFT_17522 [Amanita muscaria Koide BX008]|uniref:Uncharacterized protein n=1 Tax=Amanita muscaria (strain Koide BX008) TaxID=946122 RepID=A0A0C2WGY2_AMAMK|nr:hypothetical protein M378DRAFT_17522 [Amanita muscaria Koide BX008]
MDLIINRTIPVHCDGGGAHSFYDFLLSLGDNLDYSLGTAVFLTGSMLEHSVPTWEGGERVAGYCPLFQGWSP